MERKKAPPAPVRLCDILEISQEREHELGVIVLDLFQDAETLDVAAKKLVQTYDADAIMIGIWLLKVIQVNTMLTERKEEFAGALDSMNAARMN